MLVFDIPLSTHTLVHSCIHIVSGLAKTGHQNQAFRPSGVKCAKVFGEVGAPQESAGLFAIGLNGGLFVGDTD